VGLALLAERVVARGGQLGIVSEPGRGTRLTLDMGHA
jgi:signal transduction histidine kinase